MTRTARSATSQHRGRATILRNPRRRPPKEAVDRFQQEPRARQNAYDWYQQQAASSNGTVSFNNHSVTAVKQGRQWMVDETELEAALNTVSNALNGAGAPLGRSDNGDSAVAWALHKTTRIYGALAIIVPVIGILLAFVQGRLGEIWISVAMILTAVAGALLVLRIAPEQRDALNFPGDRTRLRHIRMLAGVFNVLWVLVVIMMIVRPGSEFS